MDELHYRSTYSDINPQRCVFEKAINSRVCNCAKSQRFNLADREGVACNSTAALQRCGLLIEQLHENARFALQRLDIDQLGHAQEIKIQNGGLLGIQAQINSSDLQNVADIDSVIDAAVEKYETLEHFPYSKIMQAISAYQIRSKRKSRKNKKPK